MFIRCFNILIKDIYTPCLIALIPVLSRVCLYWLTLNSLLFFLDFFWVSNNIWLNVRILCKKVVTADINSIYIPLLVCLFVQVVQSNSTNFGFVIAIDIFRCQRIQIPLAVDYFCLVLCIRHRVLGWLCRISAPLSAFSIHSILLAIGYFGILLGTLNLVEGWEEFSVLLHQSQFWTGLSVPKLWEFSHHPCLFLSWQMNSAF